MSEIDFMKPATMQKTADEKPVVRRGKPRKDEPKPVDLYLNVSHVKLHTSKGIVWPKEEVTLEAIEAKAFGSKLKSRT